MAELVRLSASLPELIVRMDGFNALQIPDDEDRRAALNALYRRTGAAGLAGPSCWGCCSPIHATRTTKARGGLSQIAGE